MHPLEQDFAQWEKTPPPEVFGDSIWRLPAYRLSRYLALIVREDVAIIRRTDQYKSDQLERAVDSIGINIAEGYGRLSGRERARFYEFALGSAREARDWYARVEGILAPGAALGRAKLLSRTIRILTVAIPQERAGSSERRLEGAIERRRNARPNAEERPRVDGNEPQNDTSTS